MGRDDTPIGEKDSTFAEIEGEGFRELLGQMLEIAEAFLFHPNIVLTRVSEDAHHLYGAQAPREFIDLTTVSVSSMVLLK